MPPDLLPDIQNGFILNDFHADDVSDQTIRNVFMTEIQGVLYNDETTYALSHECRGENVNVFNTDKLIKEKSYEFVALLKINHQEQMAKVFRQDHFFNVNPFLPYNSHKNKFKTMKLRSMYQARHSSYQAPLRAVEYIPFTELLDALMTKSVNLRNLFIKYTLEGDKQNFTLLTPACYVNFPHRRMDTGNYIQPISGVVPIFFKGRVHLGYIVSLIRDGEMKGIECALMEELNLLDALMHSPFLTPQGEGFKQRLKPFIKTLYRTVLSPIKNVCHLFSYTKHIDFPGHCEFYRYASEDKAMPERLRHAAENARSNADKQAQEFSDAFKWIKEGI
jgi:hypothetical protein